MDQLLIYTEKITPRLSYISEQICSEIMNLPCRLTSDETIFENTPLIKINYSKKQFKNALQIIPFGLLEENGILKKNPELSKWEELPCFFKTEGEIPFDLFSAAFFLITRYEEYHSFRLDQHNRFRHTDSLAYNSDFLQLPLVDLWAIKLRQKISIFSEVPPLNRDFQFLPTLDVDNFYKYRGVVFFRTILRLIKNLLKGNFYHFKQQLCSVLRIKKDPYFNLQEMDSLHAHYETEPIFFFHLAGYGRFDKKNILRPNPKKYISTIKQLSKSYRVGIHPSYKAAFDKEKTGKEIAQLASITKREIYRSRFHFLRFSIPESYRMLIELGIRKEYSMLYAREVGFRASTSIPFYFYDIGKEIKTDLKIYPVAVMDTTLREHKKITAKESSYLIMKMMRQVEQVKGTFITLFHNQNLTTEKQDKSWVKLYKSIIKESKKL